MNQMKQGRGARQMKAKVLHHLEVHRGEEGGHVVVHHFDNNSPGDGYHEPEMHPFGADEGDKAMAHIGKHMGIKVADVESESGESERGGTSAEAEQAEA